MKINNVVIDFTNEVVAVNGERLKMPMIVSIEDGTGYGVKKLFNPYGPMQSTEIVQISVDMSKYQKLCEDREQQELKMSEFSQFLDPH